MSFYTDANSHNIKGYLINLNKMYLISQVMFIFKHRSRDYYHEYKYKHGCLPVFPETGHLFIKMQIQGMHSSTSRREREVGGWVEGEDEPVQPRHYLVTALDFALLYIGL